MLDVAFIGTHLPRWGSRRTEEAWRFAVQAHPPGATGVAKCVELSQRLRGVAMNQVDGARIALERNMGGPTVASAVMTLEGPANGAR